MPNYVKNRMEIIAPSKERLEEILIGIQSVNEENGEILPIDFNCIDPMPEELQTNFSLGEEMVARYLVRDLLHPISKWWSIEEWNEITDEQKERCMPGARRMIENILKYGYPYWHDWAIGHWGTKWNAAGASREDVNVISFQTAWSFPDKVLRTLSEKFADTTFKVSFADEDIGCNCGIAEIKNGEVSICRPAACSVEAYELAFSLWPNRREDYVLTEDGYEAKEETK